MTFTLQAKGPDGVRSVFFIVAALFFFSGCSSEDSPQRSEAFDVTIRRLADVPGPVWWMGKEDFDMDANDDILIAGHRGVSGARIFYSDPELDSHNESGEKRSGHHVLGMGSDRHGCAVADITATSLPDIFCVSGAERGKGSGENELWRNVDGYSFERIPNHGAEDAFARGRLARFFNFDGQHPPELATTVWGERDDSLPNASRVWHWENGSFEAIETNFGERWGGRCITVFDLNSDGFDDLLACAENRGSAIFLNNGRMDFEKRAIGGPFLRYSWWWDIAVTPDTSMEGSLIAFTAQNFRRQRIYIGQISATLDLSVTRAILCNFEREQPEQDVFCARVVWHDVNADGAPDLYVARRENRENTTPYGDVDDLIIFGPTFDSYVPVERSAIGASSEAISLGDGIVRLTAGESWPGAIDLIRVVDRENQ